MWWQQDALEQWLQDFLRDALRKRGLNPLLSDPQDDPSDLISDPRSFGFSSLDMVQLAGRFAACMGLNRTGLSDLLLARRSAKGWCELARRSRQINDKVIGFYSSGSTGSPKPTHHLVSKLFAEAEFFARTLPTCRRVVCIVPSHHIYGFIWGILIPAELKVPCVFINAATSLTITWAKQLAEHDMIVATPDTWQMLMDLDIRLPQQFVGISSTAPLAANIAAFFRSHYPEATLAEIYGSTETGGIAWRTKCDTGFKLLPWWEMTQANQGTTVLSSISAEQHLLQDRIQLDHDRKLSVFGRIDNVVQIAGHNINLETLAKRITLHPHVSGTKVQCDHHSSGARLHYFVALTREPADLEHWCLDFSSWLEQQLSDIPPPASIVVAGSLPRGLSNKVVTWDTNQYEAVIGVYRSAFP